MRNYELEFKKAFEDNTVEQFLRSLNDVELIEASNIDSSYLRAIISQEIEFRKLSKVFEGDEKVADFISKYFSSEVSKIDINSPEFLHEFYKDTYLKKLQWMPIGLSLETIYVVYKHLINEGKDLLQIAYLYTADISKSLSIYNKVKDKYTSVTFDEIKSDNAFKDFIYNCLVYSDKNKSETESFKRMYKRLADENEDLLRRLQ